MTVFRCINVIYLFVRDQLRQKRTSSFEPAIYFSVNYTKVTLLLKQLLID